MTGCQSYLNYHVVILLNLNPLSVTNASSCHCKSAEFFRISQPELLLGSVKKLIF